MRGIAALIHFDGRPVSSAAIDSLLRAIAICRFTRLEHQAAGEAALGHFAQAAVPEDAFEAQPLRAARDSAWLVADALLHNRAELADLFGWAPALAAQKADSDFVRAAYERWGEESPRHLEGRFAFAVWQPLRRRFFAAVDPLSFRPLYFHRQGSRFACSTTLRGLFSLPDISKALNDTAVAESFVGLRRLGPETIYRDISRIPNGHTLVVEANTLRLTRYWQPWPQPELRLRRDADYVEAFRAEFERAVRVSLRSRGEIAVDVSGGLDSSAVTAVAGRMLAAEGRRLHAHHRVPGGTNRYAAPALRELDESRYVEMLRAHCPHIDFHFDPSPPLVPLSEDAIAAEWADHYVPLAAAPVTAAPGAMADKHYGLLLYGFGGNFIVSPESAPTDYHAHLARTGRWWTLQRELRGHRRVYGLPWRALGRELRAQLSSHHNDTPPLRMRLIHPELRAQAQLVECWREARAEKCRLIRARDFRACLAQSLTELMPQHVGASLSAVGRSHHMLGIGPLMSTRLNEFCLRLPPRQQFRDGWDRRLLREAMKGLLPDPVRLRVTRGLPQPEFQRDFDLVRGQIRREITATATAPALERWFDLEFAAQLAREIEAPHSPMATEQAATRFVNWTSFIRWLGV